MAHERLTPEGRGVKGIRVESREGEGLTVPVLYNLALKCKICIQQLLEALVTATTALSENPPLSPLPLAPGYKAGTRPDNLNSLNLDSNASEEEIFQRVSHLLPYSLEELRDMQSRLGIDAVVTIIVQALLGQLVNLHIHWYDCWISWESALRQPLRYASSTLFVI
ncbi:hypothetical protein OUZ56_010609 [Daphnia magna]|uniref:Uncharacterized protein n=1 Tax=Daphnia magna TaxID=35525 RepID=A0ABR0AJ15_9CRUS|nr:hypothetical protein OUZ56_010609 [Daphnia magna]